MPSFLNKLKSLASPSFNSRRSKSANDLSYNSTQGYIVKDKDLSKLQLAAWKGDINKVTELCKPSKIDVADKEGRTPLHLAVYANHKSVVNHLLDQGAKLTVFDKERRSPLTLAAISGHTEVLSILINSNKVKASQIINEDDAKGLNALHYAVRHEKPLSLLLLNILLNIDGLDVNHGDRDGNTPIHIAVINKNYEVVKTLSENNSDLDTVNCDGRTPFILAAISGLPNIMKLLLDNNCDRNRRDNDGKTAEDYGKTKPECLDVLRGTFRQTKSFTKQDKNLNKNNQNLQVIRSPSLGHEATLSDDVRSSKTDKFEKLFAGGGQSVASNVKYSEDYENNDEDDENDNVDDDENLNTSQINDDKQESHAFDVNKSEKVNSWNDSDISFIEHTYKHKDNNNTNKNNFFDVKKENKLTNQNPVSETYDSIFQNMYSDEAENRVPLTRTPQSKPKVVVKKQDSQNSDDNSWFDDSTPFENNANKKNVKKSPEEKSFSFITLGNQKAREADSETSKNDDIKNAGTDAHVHIKIFGTKTSSNQIWLDKDEKNNNNLFEKGNCDKFVKLFPDIGKPVKIRIGHDNSGTFAGWHLDKVVLQNLKTQEKYTFTAKRWLAKDELDHKTEIDINVDENKKDDSKSYNSWNSSGDEDSSLSSLLKKPLSPRAKPLNQINEELNETFGSKKSVQSAGDQQVNKISNENLNQSEEISMKNLSEVEKLINNLIKPSDSKSNLNNTSKSSNDDSKIFHEKSLYDMKINNHNSINANKSSENESMDLVDLLLNEMNSTNEGDLLALIDEKPPSLMKKLSSISLISLNNSNTSEQQQINKNLSSLTQVTTIVNSPLNNSSFASNILDKQQSKINNETNNNTSGIMFANDTSGTEDGVVNKLTVSTSNIFIRPFSSMSDDNDPYQTSTKSFVQLTGTLTNKNDSKQQDDLIEEDVDEGIDEIQLDATTTTNLNQNRIINFASLSKQKHLDEKINKNNSNNNTQLSTKVLTDESISDKMNVRETSWANQQQRNQKQEQIPPEISDIDGENSDVDDMLNVSFGDNKSPFYNKGPLNTFSKGNQQHNNSSFTQERGIDVIEDNSKNKHIIELVKTFTPKSDVFTKHDEDFVDLDEISDDQTSSKQSKGASKPTKYPIVSALVKPVISNQPHHGVITDEANSDTDSDNDKETKNFNTGKFSVVGGSLKTPLDPHQVEKIRTQKTPETVPNLTISGLGKIFSPKKEMFGDSNLTNSPKASPSKDVNMNTPTKYPTLSALVKPTSGSPIVHAQSDSDTEYENDFNDDHFEQIQGSKNDAISTLGKIFSPNKQNLHENESNSSNHSPITGFKKETTTEIKYPTISALLPNTKNIDSHELYEDVDEDSDEEYENLFRSANKIKDKPTNNQQKPGIKQNNHQSNETPHLNNLITQLFTTSKSTTNSTNPIDEHEMHENNEGAIAKLATSLGPDKKKWTNFNEIDKKQQSSHQNVEITNTSPVKSTNENKTNYSVLNALVTEQKNPNLINENQNMPINGKNETNNGTLGKLMANLTPKSNVFANEQKNNETQNKTTNDPTNSALGKLIQNLTPKINQNKVPNNDVEHVSDVESTSEMKTSKIEELISKFQPNQTTWSQANKKLDKNLNNPQSNESSISSSPTKQPNGSGNKYFVLGAIAGQDITQQKQPSETNDKQQTNETSKYSVIGHLVNQNYKNNNKPKQGRDDSSPTLQQLISQNMPPKNQKHDGDDEEDEDEDEDDEAEKLRKKRVEQEEQLKLAKIKQKDHAGSLSSDFDDDEDVDNGIVVEPPIAFSKHSGNASTSGGTLFTNSGGASSGNNLILNALNKNLGGNNNNKNSNNSLKKMNSIDVIDFSTSESDFYVNNDLIGSETNNFKKQFDMNSNNTPNSLNTLMNQQLKTKQTEIAQLKQQLDETLKQKKHLEDLLKASSDKTKDLQAVLSSTENVLAEKEKLQLVAGSKNAESDVVIKKNTLLIKDLQTEINNLKTDKKNLESRLFIFQTNATNAKGSEASLIQSLNEQNEKLGIEIKALKHQIQELNADRNKLSERKEELSAQLDESEMSITKHQEALEKAIIQFNLEKTVIKDENAKLKIEMKEANELKKKLNNEVEKIKFELNENKLEIEKLTREKVELERSVDRETHEKERLKSKYEADIKLYKEQQLQLIEKLGFTEAKLISAEKEYKFFKNAVQEKHAQLDELKDSIAKLRSELNIQEGLLNKEKEEKIRLSAKNESMEERLKQIQEENASLKKQHYDYVETNKFEKIHTLSLKEVERKKMESDKEVNLLKQDVNILNQKLQNAELELKSQKNVQTKPVENNYFEKTNVQETRSKPSSDDKETYMEESRKLKMELNQLRNEFHSLLSKYEVPENDQYYPTRENEMRPQDLVMNKLRTNKVDIPNLITSAPTRNVQKYESYPTANYPSGTSLDYYNNNSNHNHNVPSYDPSRTTIIVPNCDIFVPNSSNMDQSDYHGLPPKSFNKSYNTTNRGACDKCMSETQNYIDIVRNEIARTVELQAAKELPLSTLTYKTSISNHNNLYSTNTNKLDNYESLRNSILENNRYTTTNFDLINSLRSKYFV